MTRRVLWRGGAAVARLAHPPASDSPESKDGLVRLARPPAPDGQASSGEGDPRRSARRPTSTVLRGRDDGPGPASAGEAPGARSGELSGWEVFNLGRVAIGMGAPLDANPYPQGSGRALIWRHGWHCGHSGHDPLLRGAVRRNVQRETRRPGKGRALVGRRGEWSEAEDEALLLLAERLHTAELAAMLRRPERGVRNRRCRLRKLLRQAQDEGRAT